MGKKKQNTYYVNEIDSLKEFYQLYDQFYWIRKSNFLKDTYDNHPRVSKYFNRYLKSDLGNDSELFRKSIALDIHFLGFQMIESLFEMIFALLKRDHKHLWFEISNSDWNQNYKYIEKVSKGDFNFLKLNEKLDVDIGDKELKIDKLRWIFYYLAYDKTDQINWDENISIVRKILTILAKEFVERDSYNSYKHGLRLYNGKFGFSIANDKTPDLAIINSHSDNGITYLTNKLKKEDETTKYYLPQKTTELIDIERDHKRNLVTGELIHNLIASRAPYMQENASQTEMNTHLYFFEGFDTKELYPNATVSKFSFSF